MKRVIITGGTGFVGSNLTRRLLVDGHQVHLLVRPSYNPWRIQEIQKDVQLHQIDFTQRDDLANIIKMIKPDWVFHLAAHGAYSWQTDLRQMVETNIIGTINLVEACLKTGFEAFINTGTSSEYGFKDHSPSEEERLEPNSHYAVTKASASLFCNYVARSKGLRIYTFRLYSVYGPYEDPKRLIPTLIRYGLKGTLPPLVDPDIAHDYIYIDDVVDAYILAASTHKQDLGVVYNVGTGKQTSMREVVEIACKILKIKIEPKWSTLQNRIWDTHTWVADNRLIKEKLNWQPKYSFEEGFRKTIEEVINNQK